MRAVATSWVERVLNRPERPEPIAPLLHRLRARGGTVLVTGGLGSLGTAVGDVLEEAGLCYVLADEREMDVTDAVQVASVMRFVKPSTILHLAGAKHAPEGEVDPSEPARVHIDGTRNVLDHAPAGTSIVTASTCKACDPETAYGASKLIAERLTLNAGQRVARFHNVVETSGNVFETWRKTDGSIAVMPCMRYFISRAEAVSLLLFAASAPSGRYCVNPRTPHDMLDVARRLYPDRRIAHDAPRRGDRTAEPLYANCERALHETRSILRIVGPHDPGATE
jgi:FlaA1/EpsC-like NDP-sugar epimerase